MSKSIKIILAIIVVAALGLSTYAFLNTQKQPKEEKEVVSVRIDEPTPIKKVDQKNLNLETYKNQAYGFEFQLPISWSINDNLTSSTCCLNIFSSDRPYETDHLKNDVIKAQFQFVTYPEVSSKNEFIQNGLKKNERSMRLILDENSVKSVANKGNLGIIKFTSELSGFAYFVPLKTDYSEGILVLSWNDESSAVDEILSTFKSTK